MPFEFVSSVNAVARQQQLWGNMIGAIGIAILLFSLWRYKGFVLILIGIALIATGAYYHYRAQLLGESGGEWNIRINENIIHWQSPNQQIDPSFSADIAEIDFIDKGVGPNKADDKPVYHLVFRDQSYIRLSEISGIDMTAFIDALKRQGLEVKQTNQFFLPLEQRHK